MTTERRYSDEDVHRILARAAESDAALEGEPGDRPWTLAAIQRVGAEAGLGAGAIAAAAVALDRESADAHGGRYLGLPIAVAHAVPLDRPFGDEDWRRLVARLRDTFEAHGREQVVGGRREWWNGNLRITHEPVGDGALLELRTRKRDARPLLRLGIVLTLASAALAALALIAPGGELEGTVAPTLVGAIGLLTLLFGALRLPAWAGLRARQFEALARFARGLTGSS
jgi:hypothetical protein